MFQKYTYSNGIGKARKLYILVGITLPLAVPKIVLAWAEGNLRSAVPFFALSASWSIFVVYSAWRLSRQERKDKAYHTAEVAHQHRRLIIFEKIVSIIVLIGATALLVGAIISHSHLHFILGALWWIITSGGQLFYVSIMPDEWIVSHKS